MSKLNGHTKDKTPEIKLQYQIENEKHNINLGIENIIKGSTKEIETIKKLLRDKAGILVAFDGLEIIVAVPNPETLENIFIMITIPEEPLSKSFKTNIAQARLTRQNKLTQKIDDPLIIHFSPRIDQMACEIEENHPVFANIQSVEIISEEEYDRRYENYANNKKKSNKEQHTHEIILIDDEAQEVINKIEESGTSHVTGKNQEEINRTIEIFRSEAPHAIGIDEDNIITATHYNEKIYYHKITLPKSPASKKWIAGINQQIHKETHIHSSKNLRVMGYELKLEDLDINTKTEKALVTTIIESIQEISEVELLNRITKFVEENPHEDEETQKHRLNELQEMLIESKKNQNQEDN